VRRGLFIGVAVAGLLAGTCVAIGASRGGSGRADRRAFLADVERRLNIDPRAFTGFGAGRARVSPSLEERIRERLEQSGGGPPLDTRMFRYPGHGMSVDAAAGYLGLPRWQVRDALRSGASLADIAAEHGKSVKGLRRAITAETRRRLAAVANLSDVERQQLLNRVIGQLDEMVQRDGRPSGWSGRGGP
jgi:hypothetical protein